MESYNILVFTEDRNTPPNDCDIVSLADLKLCIVIKRIEPSFEKAVFDAEHFCLIVFDQLGGYDIDGTATIHNKLQIFEKSP